MKIGGALNGESVCATPSFLSRCSPGTVLKVLIDYIIRKLKRLHAGVKSWPTSELELGVCAAFKYFS